MKIPYIAFGLVAVLALSSCANKESASKADNSIPAGNTETIKSGPEIRIYCAMVDNLLLRDQPNKNGRVLAKIREGEFLSGTGELSSNKEEAVLREITYKEPYHKVQMLNTSSAGWAFGGGLLCVYAGSAKDAPEMSRLSQLSNFLKSLPVKKIDSGKRAWNYVKTNFGNASGPLADAAFILLEQHLRRMEVEGEYYSQTEKIDWAQEDYEAVYRDSFNMNKYPITKQLAENGFRLETAEGMIFPVTDWKALRDFFEGKVTPAMKSFIEQRTYEQAEQEYEDGGLIIPLHEVADRAVFWEKFNAEYPYFPLRDQTQVSESWGSLTLITGADNTPSYDYESKNINADFRAMWEYVVKKYPGTKTAALIKEMQSLCAAENWKRTQKVDEFVEKKVQQAMEE